MEELSAAILKEFKSTADRILHVPGNFTKGNILEMSVIVDKNLTKEFLSVLLPKLLSCLKMHDPVFRNVRFHIVYWEADGKMEDKVLPMAMVMQEGFFSGYEPVVSEKSLCRLAEYLTLFHARSKLVVLLTDGKYAEEERERIRKNMQPFLEKKLMVLYCGVETGMVSRIGYREW